MVREFVLITTIDVWKLVDSMEKKDTQLNHVNFSFLHTQNYCTLIWDLIISVEEFLFISFDLTFEIREITCLFNGEFYEHVEESVSNSNSNSNTIIKQIKVSRIRSRNHFILKFNWCFTWHSSVNQNTLEKQTRNGAT